MNDLASYIIKFKTNIQSQYNYKGGKNKKEHKKLYHCVCYLTLINVFENRLDVNKNNKKNKKQIRRANDGHMFTYIVRLDVVFLY